MNQLLKEVSDALIVNDAATLERLAHKAARYNESLAAPLSGKLVIGLKDASEVLCQQVLAASSQLAMRRRILLTSTLQARTWVR